jgi:hypothetical protein
VPSLSESGCAIPSWVDSLVAGFYLGKGLICEARSEGLASSQETRCETYGLTKHAKT